MMFKLIATFTMSIFAVSAMAEQTPITGNVESKCVVTTDKVGIYGNPSNNILSTDPADGGVLPVVRYDVVIADAYKAVIAHPDSFSQSPALTDTVVWTGDVSVDAVSDAGMSAYDTNKITYDNITEVELSISGSTWFKINSEATYGVGRALPGGTYTALVEANCIAI